MSLGLVGRMAEPRSGKSVKTGSRLITNDRLSPLRGSITFRGVDPRLAKPRLGLNSGRCFAARLSYIRQDENYELNPRFFINASTFGSRPRKLRYPSAGSIVLPTEKMFLRRRSATFLS